MMEGAVNKAYLDAKLAEVKGHISFIEKDYNDFKGTLERLSNRSCGYPNNVIEIAVKSTIQTFYDKGSFDNYDDAYDVL